MRSVIALLLVVGCKSDKIPLADKLEPPREELVVVPPPIPPASPHPAQPPPQAWMPIEELGPELGVAITTRLAGFDRGIGICLAIAPDGVIYGTRVHDADGSPVTDPAVLKRAAELRVAGPLTLGPDAERVPQRWVCTREPGVALVHNVAPVLLEANRISGDKLILPDGETKRAIAASKRDKIIGTWKTCVDLSGNVSEVKVLKSTGFPAYDATVEAGIRTWKYKPYTALTGKPVRVCTAITFIYSAR